MGNKAGRSRPRRRYHPRWPEARPAAALPGKRADTPPPKPQPWWRQWLATVGEEARSLVRVGRIEQPEAVLLAPDQGGPLREATSRAEAGFAFGGLGPGRYALRAQIQAAAGPTELSDHCS